MSFSMTARSSFFMFLCDCEVHHHDAPFLISVPAPFSDFHSSSFFNSQLDFNMKKFAVVDCEDDPWWSGHPRYFVEALSQDTEQWDVFRAYKGEFPDVKEYKGVVL